MFVLCRKNNTRYMHICNSERAAAAQRVLSHGTLLVRGTKNMSSSKYARLLLETTRHVVSDHRHSKLQVERGRKSHSSTVVPEVYEHSVEMTLFEKRSPAWASFSVPYYYCRCQSCSAEWYSAYIIVLHAGFCFLQEKSSRA